MLLRSLKLSLALLFTYLMVMKVTATASNGAGRPTWCSNPNQFYCYKSDECKPAYVKCDHIVQCPDGEDEEDCTECTAENAASMNMFHCHKGDNECVSSSWKCDGTPDCEFGEDEEGCATGGEVPCTEHQFSCGKGRCIDATWACDGQLDCPHGEDEEQCEPTCPPTQVPCRPHGSNSTEALSDAVTCISSQWLCDGEKDCSNGEDELNCPAKECPSDRFNCSAENKCIPNTWRCDGDDDCESGEDEKDCPDTKPTLQLCTHMEFKCKSGSIPCIIGAWTCDGDRDCADGSDEDLPECAKNKEECGSAEFKCDDGSCIPRVLLCSGNAECKDKSDESPKYCTTNEPKVCDLSKGEVKCDKDLPTSDCVGLGQICDGQQDCRSNRDESSEFCGSTYVSDQCHYKSLYCGNHTHVTCTNVKTELRSNHNLTVGYLCGCQKGYSYADKDCTDINECKYKENPVCDQLCTNTIGSFRCGCTEGYYLALDNRTCLVDHTVHPRLLFTNRHEIRSMHIRGKGNYMPLLNTIAAVALDFDYSTQEVFYSDMEKKKLFKFTLPSPNTEDDLKQVDLEIPGIQTPDGLAYDWIYKHLYWTDTTANTINMACVDGERLNKDPRVLYQNTKPNCTLATSVDPGKDVCIDEPRALAVHPKKGWMFWSDWGNKPHIVLAGLDGSKMEMIAYNEDSSRQFLLWPNGLTLDLSNENERLYWIDARLHSIFSCTVNRCMKDMDVLVYNTQNIRHPFSITVFENKLYWSDWSSKHIVSANKYTGGNITRIIENLEQPMDLKVYHPMSQQSSVNVCNDTDGKAYCDQICVPRPWIRNPVTQNFEPLPSGEHRYTCLCTDGYRKNGDKCELIDKPLPGGGKPGGKPAATKPPSVAVDAGAREQIAQTAESSGMSVGVVAAIASTCVLFVFAIIGVALFIVVRRVRQNKSKSMNFDNPIYKRTTEDKLELPRHEYQPSHTQPSVTDPLTSSEASSSSQDHFDV